MMGFSEPPDNVADVHLGFFGGRLGPSGRFLLCRSGHQWLALNHRLKEERTKPVFYLCTTFLCELSRMSGFSSLPLLLCTRSVPTL